VLHAGVDRHREVRAVYGLAELVDRVGDSPAGHVLLRGDRAGQPAKLAVLSALDAVLAIAIDVHIADHLGGKGRPVGDAAHRVDALRLRQHPHAAQVERANGL